KVPGPRRRTTPWELARKGKAPSPAPGHRPAEGTSARGTWRLPVDRDLARLVGVLLEPAPGEGAPGHHGQRVRRGAREGGADQAPPDAVPAPLFGDLRVDQHHPVAIDDIDELGL